VFERWAERLGVEHAVLLSRLRATIERREHQRAAFSGADVIGEDDHELYELYPDAVPCLERLRAAGLVVGVAGNQPRGAEAWLREQLGPGVLVASSASLGAEKPSPAFFRGLLELAGLPPARVAYIGDRVDNDVVPAAALGMRTVFVRRGPWGVIHGDWPEADRADARVDDLDAAAEAVFSL